MGTYNSAVITTAGQSLLARAIADNLPFYFSSAKTTEYVVPTGTSAVSLTELPNVKQSDDITSATVSGGNKVATSVRFDNTEITLNYSINTIGVYARVGTDTEETLLAVITAITADVMPSYSAANPVSYVYSINLAISNASSINIVVSPTGTVNVAEFNELKERVDEIIDSGTGLSTDAKMALLNCFEHVAWIDDQGQTYYNTLHDALFPTAVSISATFTPGSHVFYETDSLDALRPYLIVRATMPDSSVEIVTDYVLTGSMAVGTNTITVRYQGITDTFEVTTIADPAYITAVFTQPSETIYTDDALDTLKSNLVVTYYTAPGATGTVLADSAYTLSGTLTEGTSTITATYNGLSDTFNVTGVVDYYNIWTWDFANNASALHMERINLSGGFDASIGPTFGSSNSQNSRTTFAVTKGRQGTEIKEEDGSSHIPTYYPLPVPPTATSVTVSIVQTTQYLQLRACVYNEQTSTWTSVTWDNWTQGSITQEFTAGQYKYLVFNCKYDSGGSWYNDNPRPDIVVTFS